MFLAGSSGSEEGRVSAFSQPLFPHLVNLLELIIGDARAKVESREEDCTPGWGALTIDGRMSLVADETEVTKVSVVEVAGNESIDLKVLDASLYETWTMMYLNRQALKSSLRHCNFVGKKPPKWEGSELTR